MFTFKGFNDNEKDLKAVKWEVLGESNILESCLMCRDLKRNSIKYQFYPYTYMTSIENLIK